MLMFKNVRPWQSFQRASEAPNLPNTPFRFVCYFVNQFRWWYVAMVVSEILHATCGIMLPYAIGEIIRTVTVAHTNSGEIFAAIKQPLTLFTFLIIGEVVFGRAAGLLQTILHPIHRQHIVRSLYAYLQYHSHRYLSSSFAGALAHRIGETSLGVTQTMQMLITEFMSLIIVYVVSTILLYRTYPPLAALVGTWAVLFITISFWLATRCRIYSRRAAAARSDTTGIIVDAVTNLSSTRLFARLGFEREYLNERLRYELKEVRRANWYSERIRWFQFISAAILKVSTLYYSIFLWSGGLITAADFVVATSLSLLIISEAKNLSRRFIEFFEHIGNIANGVHIIVQPHELIDKEYALAHQFFQGRIEFRQVNFSYSREKKVFENLSVAIEPGQRVGLVGFSGSGKSTFVNLILRLFDPQSGKILIDGVDIREMTQDSLHSQISLIPQDPSLFHRTLLENIRYGRLEAEDEDVKIAAIKAYAHDFIAQMNNGYNSLVGERGVKLSGGQRQRIAIARVILKDAPILILDEATSSLDSITEKAIQETLDLAMNDKTVIVVAHRLSTISHLDRILVFDRGRIVEDGSHDDLLALGGTYYKLWKMQAGGFLPEEAKVGVGS
ncbi:ABC transporter ATP-binding protein [Cylindrospermopsis raciborskii CS-506_D]|uniref:ABC transporter ATP-binding protein n=1 Tax=Cylindrospermopsis raciborskii CS-506_A TaxID=2585140 RepID=A0A838WNB6_9CYAN|nr:ABC transporter ATP-binding protein [Cylindrospermopsis raciborskii]MBA4445915.1 ABC transporter ATP-binding protein [Cylindrospermopsis raciborskii CS-506_C]MBA4450154.1 ABC transporter ATP-binding protein [Cylindrospermopsis raciborskii CS-506_D]MBA4456769.1 ABC transporter ATP-binding protein [Cylindrospermopsis raciborskii CS-506_B]MBA4466127.1 ABC transporter ATP-binding protein [Cylindrospermopsis raciborskii CS-506_A]